MKKYLGIDLEFFYKNSKLTISHAIVLDYIRGWCIQYGDIDDNAIIEIDDKPWRWVDFSQMSEEMPYITSLSLSTVSRLIKDLEAAEFIKTKNWHQHKKYFMLLSKTIECYNSKKS